MNLPHFPPLSGPKMTKYVTKHYVNTVLSIKHSQGCLLTWLISECGPDNTIEYSTHIINRYSETIKAANKEYNKGKTATLSHSPYIIRADFRALVNKGLVLPTHNKKVFVVNPMLACNKRFKHRVRVSDHYNELKYTSDIKEFTGSYIGLFK
jgi:hypothetical protein